MADGASFGDALTGKIELDRTFEIKGAMAGYHYIRVENLPEPWRLKRVLWRGADVTDIPVLLDYAQIYDGIEVVLSDQLTTLTGTIVLPPGDFGQGYAVIAFPTNRMNWQPTSRYIKLAYADDKGRYAIRGLPPAEYSLAVTRAADESDLAVEELLERLSRDAQTIRLAEGDRRRLDLRAPPIKR